MRNNQLKIGFVISMVLIFAVGCNFNYSVGIPKEPTSEDLQKLVKATMADFTEALEKDDFEGLRRKTSDAFQQKYNAEEIKNSFGNFATKKDLSIPLFKEAEKTQAEFSQKAEMRKVGENYVIETKGKFPTKSPDLNFQFEYVREDGKWKLVKFNIKT
ncbi:MAG TPA: hypothetical protein PKE69_04395 [Pyrinomonadaceae bacterium]|nr:hypothetical protein [Pyrinomonadaceae bacterium]